MAMNSVGKESEKRHLGEVTGAWIFTVWGFFFVVKTNLAIYRMQKADGWIADIVLNSLVTFQHLLFV